MCDLWPEILNKVHNEEMYEVYTNEDEEIKDERINDAINTKNEFKKKGNKDKGLKQSSDNADADEA